MQAVTRLISGISELQSRNASPVQACSSCVNRRWIGTPYRHPKGTPLSGELGR
jgi:hypothetical protein